MTTELQDQPNEFSVTVRQDDIPFSMNYEIKMMNSRFIYESWIIENLGYHAIYEQRYVSYENAAYFTFFLRSEDDAIAFKLRWA